MRMRIAYITAAIVAMFTTGCHSDIAEVPVAGGRVPDGYVEVEFTANTPLMTEVVVRGVDPDGIDVQNLTLFCFNDYGLYITHTEATLNATVETPSLSGTYKAVIPDDTRIVHFVANQNPNLYDAAMFVNRTEDEIQDNMVGASGMIIYWSRVVFHNDAGFQDQLADLNNGEGVKLIRNQARISIVDPEDNGYIDIQGFVATNVYAYGTTAPYHPEKRFPTDGTEFVWPGDDFVTLPANRSKMTEISDVYNRTDEYIFEHENRLQDPVSVIIKGRNAGESRDKYYRVALIDEYGEQLMIRRNHHYKLNIVGALTYGSDTFDEALSAPATNNIWIAVADWVDEVSFDGITLAVSDTSVVLDESREGGSLELSYTIISDTALTAADAAQVTWLEGNTVAAHNINHTFEVNGKSGAGKLTLQLLELGDNAMLEGTLVVKKGRLQRTINVVLIKTQKFTPVWAATQIYGGDIGELATLKFNVPDNFPLFPFNVYVSVNSLDARTATTGRVLPVVRKGDEGWYGLDNDYGYKYVYTVTEPGVQRIYLHNVLTHEQGGSDEIILEAEFFQTAIEEFSYATHQNAIRVDNLNTYSASGVTDEYIYYRLVPRKVNAPVEFDVLLEDVSNGENSPRAINAEVGDEFFIYSRTLDALSDDDLAMFGLPASWAFDCNIYDVDDSYWKQAENGRMMMFQPANVNKTGANVGRYQLLFKTNTSHSDDMIRIASNDPIYRSATPGNTNNNYNGNTYRSFIFELSTYRPFRFAAQVAINGGAPVGTWNTAAGMLTEPDGVDHLEWSYLPKQKVDISFEVTSFMGSDNNSADPFGTSFEVYIDAPMLDIDYSRLSEVLAAKLRPHPTIEGRYIYTVDASREAERAAGNGESVKFADATGAAQTNERKTLPFVTNCITSYGDITISSEKAVCEFFDKGFKVHNTPISGEIAYYDGAQHPVPMGGFVSFAIEKSGVRLGSMNIAADGKFAITLRKEYSFTWDEDPLVLEYIRDGVAYRAHYDSLEHLYESTVLNSEPIVLRK
ncbi:MAG: hypothetical protein IKW42_07670 [Alistipes sp.]|nr:hypothetical protein [Alistipes sp.]